MSKSKLPANFEHTCPQLKEDLSHLSEEELFSWEHGISLPPTVPEQPQRPGRLLSKWESDPDEAWQDPAYWIDYVL